MPPALSEFIAVSSWPLNVFLADVVPKLCDTKERRSLPPLVPKRSGATKFENRRNTYGGILCVYCIGQKSFLPSKVQCTLQAIISLCLLGPERLLNSTPEEMFCYQSGGSTIGEIQELIKSGGSAISNGTLISEVY